MQEQGSTGNRKSKSKSKAVSHLLMAIVMKQHVDSRLHRMDRGLLASSWGASRSDKYEYKYTYRVKERMDRLSAILYARNTRHHE